MVNCLLAPEAAFLALLTVSSLGVEVCMFLAADRNAPLDRIDPNSILIDSRGYREGRRCEVGSSCRRSSVNHVLKRSSPRVAAPSACLMPSSFMLNADYLFRRRKSCLFSALSTEHKSCDSQIQCRLYRLCRDAKRAASIRCHRFEDKAEISSLSWANLVLC